MNQAELYFEDYVPGVVRETGEVLVSADEIIEFARRWDPQQMHVDAELAAQGPYGGLIASGWHTAAIMMRLLVDQYLPTSASLGSPGIDELRWTVPVRPGDRLHLRVTIIEARRSRSKPDRGLVRTFVEAVNQRGEVAMSLKAMNLFRCRS
jgi:acyl dehydratase